MRKLINSELSQLRFLRDKPGSWGEHLDRGDPYPDEQLAGWLALGWVESRPHVRKMKNYTTRFGYFLTDAGRAAFAEQEKGDA